MRPGSGEQPARRAAAACAVTLAAVAAVLGGCSGGSDGSAPEPGPTTAGGPPTPSGSAPEPSGQPSVLPGGDSPENAPAPTAPGETVTPAAPAAAAVQPPEAVAPLGAAVPVTAADGSRAEVTLLSAESSPTSRAASAETPANGRYLFVNVRITATGGPFTANPLDFSVRSGETLTDYSTGNAMFALDDGALAPQDVAAGESVTGVVAFDLPAGPAQVHYAPGDTDRAVAGWDVPG